MKQNYMIYLNINISVLILNVNGLHIPIQKEIINLNKKNQLYAAYKRQTFNIKI